MPTRHTPNRNAPRPCTHKTRKDHSFDGQGAGSPRLWICGVCGIVAPWGPGWMYYGNIECKRCGWTDIEHVWCPECAPDSAEEDGDE